MAQKPYTDQPFPGWRISPDGSEFRRFETAEEVPDGWLRETPDSFAKKGLGVASTAPVEPEAEVSDEAEAAAPVEPEVTEPAPVRRGPGRPKLDL